MNVARYAIIVAGGSGSRFGGPLPKQFCLLGGKPVLMHTIEKFVNAGAVATVVLPSAQFELWRNLCHQHNFTVPHSVVAGGDTRYQSVKNGLLSIACRDSDVIAVHDGVRPLASDTLLNRAYTVAAERGTAIPVIDVTDSVRQIGSDGCSRQLLRSSLRAVQTPQAFNARLLREAYNSEFSPMFTDDASVVEHGGTPVSLIDGETTNIKITHPIDLVVAQYILDNHA